MTDNTTPENGQTPEPTPPIPTPPIPTPPATTPPATTPPATTPPAATTPPIPTPPATTPPAAATPPAATAAPAAPEPSLAPPPPPVPPKSGLPRWVWIVVAAAAVVIIGVIVIVAMTLTSGDSSDSDKPDSVATPTSVPPEASAQPSTAPSASTEPDASTPVEQSTGDVSLDDAFVIGTSSPAIWRLPTVEGWEITTIDQEGVSVQTNAALACTFTTVQNRQVPTDPNATSDRADTESTVQALQQSFLSQAPAAVITDTQSLAIPYGVSGADVLEFAGFRADYIRNDTGEAYTSMFVTRTMPRIEGMMYSVLNCATETINADDTIWMSMLDQTVVSAGDY